MLHDLIRWLLYSRTRLMAVAAVVVAVVAVASTGLAPEPDPSKGSPIHSSAPSTALSTPRPMATHLAHERAGASRAIMSTARNFLAKYVVPPSARTPEAPPRGLQALTTPSLWKGLRLTKPDMFPRGSLQSMDLEAAGPYSGTVLAEFDDGSGLTLSVVAWQRGWRIADVRSAGNS